MSALPQKRASRSRLRCPLCVKSIWASDSLGVKRNMRLAVTLLIQANDTIGRRPIVFSLPVRYSFPVWQLDKWPRQGGAGVIFLLTPDFPLRPPCP